MDDGRCCERGEVHSYEYAATVGALLLLPGLLCLTCALSWWPVYFDREAVVNWPQVLWAFVGSVLTILAAYIGGQWLAYSEWAATNDRQYGRYLVGVGYALVTLVLVDIVLFAGLARRNILQVIVPWGGDVGSETVLSAPLAGGAVLAGELLVALLLAVSGALFYIANALRTKRDSAELFDYSRFWSGLWFRLGEVALFTLVLFVVSRWQNWRSPTFFLPPLALLIGMFVKSGEQLIFGLAERIFAATAALLPESRSVRQNPSLGSVKGLTAAVVEGKVRLTWNQIEARVGQPRYLVEVRDPTTGWTRSTETVATSAAIEPPAFGRPWEYRVTASDGLGAASPTAVQIT